MRVEGDRSYCLLYKTKFKTRAHIFGLFHGQIELHVFPYLDSTALHIMKGALKYYDCFLTFNASYVVLKLHTC
jgi:hypothetical protein